MNRILIAEDEKHIRMGLRAMVQRSGIPAEEILEARDGEEALELLKERGADLLITDVRMPRLDGIGLVEQAARLPEPPLVLVISGYDDFSYAVAMMRSGVQNYLLKPVERQQFYDALERLEAQFLEKRDAARRIEEQHQQAMRILALEPEAPERQRLLDRYAEEFYPESYIGVCTRGAEEGGILRVPIGYGRELTLYASELDIPAGTVVGISLRHQGLEELGECCQEALEAWKRAFFTGYPCVYSKKGEAAPTVTCRQLMDHLSVSRAKEMLRLLGVQAKAVAQGDGSADAFTELCGQMIRQILQVYRNLIESEETALGLASPWNWESGCVYLEELGQWLTRLSDRITQEFANFENKQKIRQAVQYVQEHYREGLNMTVVSNQVSMNYSLFSQLFKQYTGTNFVSYMQKLRLEEAKRLLESTDARVSEICYQVGFQDDKHFLKVFKAATGLSPSEYRRACIRRNHTES